VTQLKNSSKLLANRVLPLICGLSVVGAMFGPSAVHTAGPQSVNPDAEKLKAFNDRVQKYIELEKKLEGPLPSVGKTDDPAKIEAHRKALAEAIRSARRGARPGDIFGDTAEQFRLIIKQDASERSARDASASMKEVPKSLSPRINGEYPEKLPLATVPPLILARLQRLPDPLEYRFIGRDLILYDAKANLIIDLVHEAVPTIRR
jgi:hypothetical protein